MLLALNEVYLNHHLSTSGLILKLRFYPGPEGPGYRYWAPSGPELLHFSVKIFEHVISNSFQGLFAMASATILRGTLRFEHCSPERDSPRISQVKSGE